MCKNADDNVGRLLDYLGSSGLEEDTLVVFTGKRLAASSPIGG